MELEKAQYDEAVQLFKGKVVLALFNILCRLDILRTGWCPAWVNTHRHFHRNDIVEDPLISFISSPPLRFKACCCRDFSGIRGLAMRRCLEDVVGWEDLDELSSGIGTLCIEVAEFLKELNIYDGMGVPLTLLTKGREIFGLLFLPVVEGRHADVVHLERFCELE